MERTELLNNLYSARNLFSRIFQEKDTMDTICASYEEFQDEIGTSTFVDKGKIILTGAIIAYGLILLMRMQIPFLICLIAYLICKIKGKTDGKIYKILNIIFMFQGIYLIYACVTSPNQLPAYIVLFGVAGIICAVIIATKNKAVRRNNARAEEKNNDLHMQYAEHMDYYNQYQNQLAELTNGWFPQSYLTYDCVEFFIDTLENWRADDIKELVNLYEQEMHNRRMEEMQNTIINQNNQMIAQNNEMIRQQKLTNVYQLFQIGQHAYTHSLLQRECQELSAIRSNSARTAKAMDKIAYDMDSPLF